MDLSSGVPLCSVQENLKWDINFVDIHERWQMRQWVVPDWTWCRPVLLWLRYKYIYQLLCHPLHLFCHSLWDGGDQYAQKEKQLSVRFEQVRMNQMYI